jgi:putative redox protein
MATQTYDRQRTGEPAGFWATDGRRVRVQRLDLGDAQRPDHRVSLDIGHLPGQEAGRWAALTPAEARRLAAALLSRAAAADGPEPAAGEGRVEVSYLDGESYLAATRGQVVLADQPVAAGGADAAMTPVELLVASLGACVALYAGRYLERHGLDRSGLQVTTDFTMATDRPARVSEVRIRISVPGGIPPEREKALLAVASHCTVHNTLGHPPAVALTLA